MGWSRRCASLRQTRSTQISLELTVNPTVQIQLNNPQISSGGSSGGSGIGTGTGLTTPKKSNWEVIEHYNTGIKGRGSVSSSLIAAGITRCNLDESIGSTFSGSTCNSPSGNREIQQPLLSGMRYLITLFV